MSWLRPSSSVQQPQAMAPAATQPGFQASPQSAGQDLYAYQPQTGKYDVAVSAISAAGQIGGALIQSGLLSRGRQQPPPTPPTPVAPSAYMMSAQIQEKPSSPSWLLPVIAGIGGLGLLFLWKSRSEQ